MLWLVPAWVATVLVAYLLGYVIRDLRNKVVQLENVVQSKVDKKPPPEEPKSMLVDVTDPVQEAIWEAKQLQKRLNPDEE